VLGMELRCCPGWWGSQALISVVSTTPLLSSVT
jgi:hypothetical protein